MKWYYEFNTRGERLPDMCWVFQFVEHGDCIIPNRNDALACSIDQELIAP